LAGIVTEDVQEIWVSTTEAGKITGYNAAYLKKLARNVWNQPEEERSMKVRNRSRRYEFWLPDLMAYINESGHGPQRKRK
jgi:hypothetical protein